MTVNGETQLLTTLKIESSPSVNDYEDKLHRSKRTLNKESLKSHVSVTGMPWATSL